MAPGRVESYSSLATLASCCQKYAYGYVERLESPGVNLPLVNGSAMHAGVGVLYKHGWSPELLPDALDAIDEEWGETQTPFGSKKAWLTKDFAKTRLEAYVEERAASPTVLELGSVVSDFSEEMHEFEWLVGDGLVKIRGIPDLVVTHEGKTYVVDFKFPTSGWLNDFYFLRFSLGHQIRIYMAMYEQLTGVHVHGGIINAVSCAEKSIDPPEKWKTRKSSPSLLRVYDYSPEQVEDAHEWVRGLLEVRDMCAATGRWPRNELGCDDYGGCEFLPLCGAPGARAREARKMTQFTLKERR